MTITQEKTGRLAGLRAKTDRDLLTLIGRTLDRGLEWAGAPESYSLAEEAYSQASQLLPALDGVAHAHRQQLETKLAELRGQLQPKMRAAC